MEHTSGPRGYEVPRSSTLLSSSEAVTRVTAVENGAQQGEIYYNMGCHDDRELCNSTATPTYGNMAEHEYQEADFTSKSTDPLLEVSVLTISHPCVDTVTAHIHAPCTAWFCQGYQFGHHSSTVGVCLVVTPHDVRVFPLL